MLSFDDEQRRYFGVGIGAHDGERGYFGFHIRDSVDPWVFVVGATSGRPLGAWRFGNPGDLGPCGLGLYDIGSRFTTVYARSAWMPWPTTRHRHDGSMRHDPVPEFRPTSMRYRPSAIRVTATAVERVARASGGRPPMFRSPRPRLLPAGVATRRPVTHREASRIPVASPPACSMPRRSPSTPCELGRTARTRSANAPCR